MRGGFPGATNPTAAEGDLPPQGAAPRSRDAKYPHWTVPTNDDFSYAHDLIGCHPVVTPGPHRYRFQTPIALRASLPRKYLDRVLTKPAECDACVARVDREGHPRLRERANARAKGDRMSSNSETPQGTAAAQPAASVRTNSYSRKRWSAFDAWQEHVRKSADATHASHGRVAFTERHDRDLRRAIVTG